MPLSLQWQNQNALANRLSAVQRAATDPSSPALVSYRADLAGIVYDDHIRKMLTGTTRYGQARAPLAKSTLKRRRGSGPSLIPLGMVSRWITNFRLEWLQEGQLWVLSIGFDPPIVSRKGVLLPPIHEEGNLARNLPARPTMGITPQGMADIRRRHQELPLDILSKAGRFGTYRS